MCETIYYTYITLNIHTYMCDIYLYMYMYRYLDGLMSCNAIYQHKCSNITQVKKRSKTVCSAAYWCSCRLSPLSYLLHSFNSRIRYFLSSSHSLRTLTRPKKRGIASNSNNRTRGYHASNLTFHRYPLSYSVFYVFDSLLSIETALGSVINYF